MDFLDLIDKNKVAEREAARAAEWKKNNPPEKIAEHEAARAARGDARERGKLALGIVREETGPNYKPTFYNEAGQEFTLDELEEAGR